MRIDALKLDQPVFVLTADVDWASEHCIEALAGFAGAHGITPTLFVTHASAAIARLRAAGAAELGIHPNFLPDSSHGGDPGAVIAHVLSIVPQPVATRSHHYVESSEICRRLFAGGLRVDSNVCLFLQPALSPLQHWSGLTRLPCFWEDDIHWERGLSWDVARHKAAFLTPGLKILNVHPFMLALNIPDGAFYARHKRLIPTLDAAAARELRFPGARTATFLAGLVELVHAEGLRFGTLGTLADALAPERTAP
jgi:hypothetical protein